MPTNYDFVYSVHDSYSGDEHSHSERKTDSMTEGQYSVRLPDGRTQVRQTILTYLCVKSPKKEVARP